MRKANFKEGINFNEGVQIKEGVDFKRIDTISPKNTPKASLWARSFRYGKGASYGKTNTISPREEYTPKNSSRWSVAVVLPEGFGSAGYGGFAGSKTYNKKMDLFKAGGYSRRCVVRVGYTRPGQFFSNSGKMNKFLEGSKVDNGGYNKGLVAYISRADATIEQKPQWDDAQENLSLYTEGGFRETKQITREEAIALLESSPVFKIVISPEDPDVDFHLFSSLFMERLSKKFKFDFKWCASNHYNTEHPHVHILCSRRTENGQLVRLSSPFVIKGIKKIAEDVLTQLQGPVSWEKEMEKIDENSKKNGFSDIDKRIVAIARTNPEDPTRIPAHRLSSLDARSYLQISKRLQVLEKKGLVKHEKYDKEDPLKKESNWVVSKDFEERVRKLEFSQELEMDVSAFVVDKGLKNYKCSLIKAKKAEDSSKVLFALVDENGVKHLREEELLEEIEFTQDSLKGVFDIYTIKDLLESREERTL